MTDINEYHANGVKKTTKELMVDVVAGLRLWVSDERRKLTLLVDETHLVLDRLNEKKKQEIASESMKFGEYVMD